MVRSSPFLQQLNGLNVDERELFLFSFFSSVPPSPPSPLFFASKLIASFYNHTLPSCLHCLSPIYSCWPVPHDQHCLALVLENQVHLWTRYRCLGSGNYRLLRKDTQSGGEKLQGKSPSRCLALCEALHGIRSGQKNLIIDSCCSSLTMRTDCCTLRPAQWIVIPPGSYSLLTLVLQSYPFGIPVPIDT